MKRASVLVAILTLAVSMLLPATALADSANHNYAFFVDVPNVSQASNGDRVAITGRGTISVNPKSAEGAGTFTHTTSTGALVGAGTWRATELLEYQSYGCGVVHNFPTPGVTTPLPPNCRGGAIKMRITTTPSGTSLSIAAILTIFCIIGPK